MSTDLERPAEILNPINGEMVPVADTKRVALTVAMIREAKRNLDDHLAAITNAYIEVARIEGRRTFDAGDIGSLTLSPDSEIEWDFSALNDGLIEAGCPEERINQLIKVKVEYSVDGTVRRQLETNPVYAAVIAAAATRVPKRPYLTIKPR